MKNTNKQTDTSKVSQARAVSVDAVVVAEAFKNDVKNSALLVSVLVNMTFLIAYLLLQVTSVYDSQVISLLLSR